MGLVDPAKPPEIGLLPGDLGVAQAVRSRLQARRGESVQLDECRVAGDRLIEKEEPSRDQYDEHEEAGHHRGDGAGRDRRPFALVAFSGHGALRPLLRVVPTAGRSAARARPRPRPWRRRPRERRARQAPTPTFRRATDHAERRRRASKCRPRAFRGTSAHALPRAADNRRNGAENNRAREEAELSSVRARQIPGSVDGLITVPFDDEGHEAKVKGAERGREHEPADVSVRDRDRARG